MEVKSVVELGVVFPQTEMPADPAAVRDFAQAAEGVGYSFLSIFDHVLGANIDRPDRAGGRWPYTDKDLIHEPLITLGYIAGATTRLGLMPSVIILPQRQTALVAKQAAEIDVLSGGRLRLGIGLGWNTVEYEALGEDFHNRGKRIEEQVAVLRALWTKDLVNFEGRWHRITDAGLNPLPVQRPIPLWMGGSAEPALRRIGRMADGWVLMGRPGPEVKDQVARVRDYAREAGRDPTSVGVQGGIRFSGSSPDDWRQDLATWESIGATHVAVGTRGAGLGQAAAHIDAIRKVKEALA
jgi:probable F420-dependent oxidoreductase